jgi:glucosyl-3-phosphoglycerate synthase
MRRGTIFTMTQKTGLLRREFHFGEFSSYGEMVRRKQVSGASVSVVIPALNEEATIGEIVRSIRETLVLGERFVDELVVIDGDSDDATARTARDAGASVFALSDIPEPSGGKGKGAALWKAQFVTTGDIVVFIDADIEEFDPRIVTGCAGPLLFDPEIYLVKAFYRRPLILDGRRYDDSGGRITELLVKPLLRTLLPGLSRVHQPLGGEYAFRRDIMEQIPFSAGYGVEIGLLIDLYARFGIDHLAQVDVGTRVHRNRSILELGDEATQIARVLVKKAEQYGVISVHTMPLLAEQDNAFGSGDIELAPKCAMPAVSVK